jgi:HEPN domain-containing protein
MRAVLDNPEVADASIALHAQQAVEKSLKALLALQQVRSLRTHDLRAVVMAVRDAGVTVPEWIDQSTTLNPYAVTFRYEDMDLESKPVDRGQLLDFVQRVHAWATELVEQAPG